MNDYMAVRTNWTQIFYGVNAIGFADFRKGFQMMYMNDISTNFTIHFFKIKTTYKACSAVMLYASVSSTSVAFIAIYKYLSFSTFIEVFMAINVYFFWYCYF